MKRNVASQLSARITNLLLLLSFYLILSACNSKSSEERGKVGTIAPSFSVVDLKGNKYDSDQLKGSVVVLNFWFIACPPCIREIPDLNDLVQKYKDDDVVFIALARDSKSKLTKFLAKNNFDYNIVARSKWMSRKFNTHGWPTNIIIDSNGEIVFYKAAYDKERGAQMDEIISSLLGDT